MKHMLKLKIPGYTIAAKTWGQPQNPVVLALHGWLDNANSFALLAPYLADKFYVIAIDLPGHGHSSHLPEGCYYHFSDGIFIIQQIINALQLNKIHLIGHSMGACLASLCGGILNCHISSLGLIEGLGPLSAPEESCAEQLSNYLKHVQQGEWKGAKPYTNLTMAAKARSKRGHISQELALILCKRGLIKKKEGYFWRHDRRLLYPTPLRMTENQILSCLAQITAPTCVLWADQGFGFPGHFMQERVAAVSDISVHHLRGGHHVHMENPAETASILCGHIEKNL